mgnify:CR=1 FL=1
MAKEDAKTAYEAAKKDIANLLGWFECELSKEPANLNWAHSGTLNKVRHDLLETLSFLSGFGVDAIKETLEESRMLDEADAEIENERKNQ